MLEAHCYQACLARLYALRRIRDASDRLAPLMIPKLWPNRHWRNVGPTERRGIYELLLHKGDEELLGLFHTAAMFFFDDKFEQWEKDLQSQKESVRMCFEELSEEVGGPRRLPDEYPVEVVRRPEPNSLNYQLWTQQSPEHQPTFHAYRCMGEGGDEDMSTL
eukprot:546769-Pyramimonas_sp.AAC.1